MGKEPPFHRQTKVKTLWTLWRFERHLDNDMTAKYEPTLHVKVLVGSPANVWFCCPNCATKSHFKMDGCRTSVTCRDCGKLMIIEMPDYCDHQ